EFRRVLFRSRRCLVRPTVLPAGRTPLRRRIGASICRFHSISKSLLKNVDECHSREAEAMGICFFCRFCKRQTRRPPTRQPETNAALKQTDILRLFSACSQA